MNNIADLEIKGRDVMITLNGFPEGLKDGTYGLVIEEQLAEVQAENEKLKAALKECVDLGVAALNAGKPRLDKPEEASTV